RTLLRLGGGLVAQIDPDREAHAEREEVRVGADRLSVRLHDLHVPDDRADAEHRMREEVPAEPHVEHEPNQVAGDPGAAVEIDEGPAERVVDPEEASRAELDRVEVAGLLA